MLRRLAKRRLARIEADACLPRSGGGSRRSRPGISALPGAARGRGPVRRTSDGPDPGFDKPQAGLRAQSRMGGHGPTREGAGRRLCLERHDLQEAVASGARDHGDALERPALLRPAGPKDWRALMTRPAPKPLRCAIYTRVSTEHGLEQDFNSLDAQREAAQAYVKSQAHEGWRLIRESFEDGGFSGGTLDRPALQRLLSSIRSGLVDVVVVYKVDRLTRSLTDFAKLVELFDAAGVSFVSVTQAFSCPPELEVPWSCTQLDALLV